MNPQPPRDDLMEGAVFAPETSRAVLWFGLVGGGIAWLAHFLTAYIASEFGCLTDFRMQFFLGLNAVAWTVIGATVISLAVAGAAAVLPYRIEKKFPSERTEWPENRKWELYMARAGRITSGIFALIILVEALPIVYFLRNC